MSNNNQIPLKHAISSVSEGDDDESYQSAASFLLPSPSPPRPPSFQPSAMPPPPGSMPAAIPSSQKAGPPPPPPPPSSFTSSYTAASTTSTMTGDTNMATAAPPVAAKHLSAIDTIDDHIKTATKAAAAPTTTKAEPPAKPPPSKPSNLLNRAVTTTGKPPPSSGGGVGSRPAPISRRGRSVGFADDLVVAASSSGSPSSQQQQQQQQLKSSIRNKNNNNNNNNNNNKGPSKPPPMTRSTSKTQQQKTPPKAAAPRNYSLDQIISSQFENEATTHILAALESEDALDNNDASNNNNNNNNANNAGNNNNINSNFASSQLLGEGIDDDVADNQSGEVGMEDYSEDEEDDSAVAAAAFEAATGVRPPPPPPPPPSMSAHKHSASSSSGSPNTNNNNNNNNNSNNSNNSNSSSPREGGDWAGSAHIRKDSFLQRVHLQNIQAQYKYDSTSVGSESETSSPVKQAENRQERGMIQGNHQRGMSGRGGSEYLQSVPDDSALIMKNVGGAIGKLKEDAVRTEKNRRTMSGISVTVDHSPARPISNLTTDIYAEVNTAGKGVMDSTSDHGESQLGREINLDDGGEEESRTIATNVTSGDAANATMQTNNTATLANRLRFLQKGRTFSRRSSRRSSFSSTDDGPSDVGAGALGAEPESYSDKLIEALHKADGPKHKHWYRKLRFEWDQLIAPKLPVMKKQVSYMLFFIIFPCLAVANILFYMFENPMAGNSNTSWSWWILFLGVRQALIFEFTRIGEIFWIEIMALRSSLFNMAVGPYVSLAFIQSKGWPYIMCFWAVLDFCFLYGGKPFAKHWLFWQNKLDVFNADNPVEGITDDPIYLRLLAAMIFIGVTVSLKRLMLALYLGRRTVYHFGDELEKLMAKMILIGEVANLAKDIENKNAMFQGPLSPLDEDINDEKLVRFRDFVRNDETSSLESPNRPKRKVLEPTGGTGVKRAPAAPPPPPPMTSSPGNSPVFPAGLQRNSSAGTSGSSPGQNSRSANRHYSVPDTSDDEARGGGESSTTSSKLLNLLSEWEEPELTVGKNSKASVQDLLQFRKAVSYMDDRYPFSHAFGPAKTRELCVESSQKVFDRLILTTDSASALPFSVFAVLATDEMGQLVDAKMKSLIRLFRPDREGTLTKLDFVKSIDTVYKQLRLLRASIANSAQIDCAFERIMNWFFYFFLAIISITILGINIWTVFLSFNTFFLGFSFLFGSAASNYFEGLLLIFVRRPYDIGDRIATSNPRNDTNPNGSSTWFVDRVTLFSTTVRFATTNEVATYSNGSLALLRIINANRSPKAFVSVLIKFGLETPFNKITVFRTAVENFVKARPREWIALAGFRATRVEADFGYVEYKIICQHRESWQNIGPILQSKADLSSFCLEVTKKLGMKYESPPMPVLLGGDMPLDMMFQANDKDDDSVQGGLPKTNKSFSAEDLQSVADLFEVRKK